MIKIKDLPAPAELTDELIEQLTEEFKLTDKTVWKKDYIRKQLLTMSEGKCCFSECKLVEEGKDLGVEHFHPKSLYPDEVLRWGNLLPICNDINRKKNNHDTKSDPIINPRFDKPKEHLAFRGYRFFGKTPLGDKTWRVLGLNDNIKWVIKRFEIGNDAVERLEKLCKRLQSFDISFLKTTEEKNEIIIELANLFYEGTPKAEYSSVVASHLLHWKEYEIIKNLLIKNDLWDDEFKELEQQLKFCALDVIS